MTQEIRQIDQTPAAFTLTMASLADNAGRQSTLLTNTNNYPSATVTVRFRTSGTVNPTADTVVEVYLLRYDGTVGDDECGTTDAALTVINATPLGVIHCDAATQNADYVGVFNTINVCEALGNRWGIAVVNRTGTGLHATEGNHDKRYWYTVPQLQNDV